MGQAYYHAYEARYRAAYEAGAARWGHAPDDAGLSKVLTAWVRDNDLTGKRVVEFACGEGASGEILSHLGCRYLGVDIAPSALDRARQALHAHPRAQVACWDMVAAPVPGTFDAALDVMGFHMLVTDAHRRAYLHNARACLLPGAPMLFFRQICTDKAYAGEVESFDQWQRITRCDYASLLPLAARGPDGVRAVPVHVPLIAARGQTLAGYRAELARAGFAVDDAVCLPKNDECPFSAAIWARKPRAQG